jgi:hypothetical protein
MHVNTIRNASEHTGMELGFVSIRYGQFPLLDQYAKRAKLKQYPVIICKGISVAVGDVALIQGEIIAIDDDAMLECVNILKGRKVVVQPHYFTNGHHYDIQRGILKAGRVYVEFQKQQ